MKKHLLSLGFAVAAITAAAQSNNSYQEKPTYQLPDGLLAVELQVNPFSNDFTTFKMGELKGRLFLNNKHVIRLAIGVGYDTDTEDMNTNTDTRDVISPNDYTVGTTTTKSDKKQTALKLGLGYEYHFASYGRLDFYAGAEAGYEGKFYSGTKTTVTNETNSVLKYSYTPTTTPIVTTSNSTEKIEYSKMLPDGSKYNERSFYANIFTGLDFYVYKNLYIGTELGISFKTGKHENGYYDSTSQGQSYRGSMMIGNWSETYSSETGVKTHLNYMSGQTTITGSTVTDRSSKSTNVKVYVEPAIRLGWIF